MNNDNLYKFNLDIFNRLSNFYLIHKDHFQITYGKDNNISIGTKIKKLMPSTSFSLELNSVGCEFQFQSMSKGLYLVILNEFEDFNDYFKPDKDYGSRIAKILFEKYKIVFALEISNGEDNLLDEEFKLNFIDNFVNVILKDVYLEL